MFRLVLVIISLSLAACVTVVPPAQQLNYEGNKALNSQDYQRAIDKYKKSLAEAEKAKDKQYTAIAMYGLARANGYSCNLEEAESWFQKSIALRENLSDVDTAKISQNIHELARLYVAQKKWQEAVVQFKRAIPLVEKAEAEAHDPIGYANMLEDYKNALHFSGEIEEANKIEKRIHYLRETYSYRPTYFKIKPYPTTCEQN